MTEIILANQAAEFDAFVKENPNGHFLQLSTWAKVKESWIWRGIICRDDNGKIKGVMALLIKKLPGGVPYSLVYAPRGPVCDIHDAAVFRELMDAAKKVAKEFKGYVIQFDKDALIDDAEFDSIARSYGCVAGSREKNFDGIQPRFVIRINIDGRSEDEVFASFHSKTRYNVRVAKKHEVEIRIEGAEAAEEFHKIMVETGARDGFSIRSAEYFAKILNAYGDDARLYMAYHEGKPIAGALAIHCGNKVWYLYGASSNEHRNLMPNYLLQWSMIQWALERGARIYDFRGVSGDLSEDNPLYGLYKFKKGFGGDFTEFVGEMDLVLNKPVYFAVEHGTNLFKEARKGVYLLKTRNKK